MRLSEDLRGSLVAHNENDAAGPARVGRMTGMSLSARLILFLTVAVGVVMAMAGYFILRQREAILSGALQNELHAHADTLRIALEDSYRGGRTDDAQRLIDRLSENPRVFHVALFDEEGRVAMLSNPLAAGEITTAPEIRRAIDSGETLNLIHRELEREVYSIIAPVRISASRRGAFEISQPADFFRADTSRARRDIAVMTLSLFGAIILVVHLVMRLNVVRPIRDLLTGARIIGQGDLSYRVPVPNNGSEITALAREFNFMAEGLNRQRNDAGREAEDRLRLERELRHSERLAVIGRLASGVAHEMGAPLNVIKGRVEMLRDRPGVPEANRLRHLAIIESQAEAIAVIVRQLLTLARPFNLKRESIAVTDLINSVVELIESEAARGGIAVETGQADQLHVRGDRALLHQVMMNVCGNALHAMPRGGRLRIEAFPDASSGKAPPRVRLRVTDTGAGIAPEDLGHIFDPFFTTKEVGQGTGLGLSVSRRIVEEHDGWIEAANREEGGAAFTICLPGAGDPFSPLPMERAHAAPSGANDGKGASG
ncbi:MAG: ATP-binding protein [Blastocatellia bacterium]